MENIAYIRPQVRDHGTLVELTADIDVNFVGAVANVVMAAITSPMTPTGDGGTAGLIERNVGGVGSGGGVGGVGSGGGLGGAPPGGGSNLPFTGFQALLLAALGAMFSGTGALIRSKLARKRS
jgi:hypothetical protein